MQLQKTAPGVAAEASELRTKSSMKRKKVKRKGAAAQSEAAAPAPAAPEGKQLSAEAASVMKKLTRVLRAVKSLRGRIESGEISKSACMAELTDLHNQLMAAQSESGATDPA